MNNFRYHEKKAPQVVSYPVRDPVNMQAVRIMRPAAYYEMPPPVDNSSEIDRLRKENMKLRESNVQRAAFCKSLQKQVEKSKKMLDDAHNRLDAIIAEREEQISKMSGEEKEHAQKMLNKNKLFHRLLDSDKRGDSYNFVVVPDHKTKQAEKPASLESLD